MGEVAEYQWTYARLGNSQRLPENYAAADVDFVEIAVVLAHVPAFNAREVFHINSFRKMQKYLSRRGAVQIKDEFSVPPYSVLEHMLNVQKFLEEDRAPKATQLAGLLYEAHRFALVGFPTPLAGETSTPTQKDIQSKADHIGYVIWAATGVDLPDNLVRETVRHADMALTVTEHRDLFGASATSMGDEFKYITPWRTAVSSHPRKHIVVNRWLSKLHSLIKAAKNDTMREVARTDKLKETTTTA